MNGRNHNLHNLLSALGVASLTLGVGAIVACDSMGDAEARQYVDEREDGEVEGCTLTQGYWKNHSIHAKNKSQQEAWPVSEDTQLCGQSWYDILHLAPKGNAWLVVAHQYIAAQLNVAAGAGVTVEVSAALDAIESYLSDCEISKAEKADALLGKDLLDAFNNGLVGPGHCGDPTPETTGGETTGGETTGGETTGGETTGTDCIVDCGTTGEPPPPPFPIPG